MLLSGIWAPEKPPAPPIAMAVDAAAELETADDAVEALGGANVPLESPFAKFPDDIQPIMSRNRYSQRGLLNDDETLRQILGRPAGNGQSPASSDYGGVGANSSSHKGTPIPTVEEMCDNYIRQRIKEGKAEKEKQKEKERLEAEEKCKQEQQRSKDKEETDQQDLHAQAEVKSMSESMVSEASADFFAEGKVFRDPDDPVRDVEMERPMVETMIEEMEREAQNLASSSSSSGSAGTPGSGGDGDKTPVNARPADGQATTSLLTGVAKRIGGVNDSYIPYLSGKIQFNLST